MRLPPLTSGCAQSAHWSSHSAPQSDCSSQISPASVSRSPKAQLSMNIQLTQTSLQQFLNLCFAQLQDSGEAHPSCGNSPGGHRATSSRSWHRTVAAKSHSRKYCIWLTFLPTTPKFLSLLFRRASKHKIKEWIPEAGGFYIMALQLWNCSAGGWGLNPQEAELLPHEPFAKAY